MAPAGLWTTAAELASFVTEIIALYQGTPRGVLTQGRSLEMLDPVLSNYGLG